MHELKVIYYYLTLVIMMNIFGQHLLILRHHPFHRANICKHAIPTAENVPRVVVGRIKVNSAVHRRLNARRSIELILAAHERQHFTEADRGRELGFGIIGREGRGSTGELKRDISKPQLFFLRRRVAHQMAVLPRDTNQKVHIVRFELVRRQIGFECLFGLESFIEFVAFCHQGFSVFAWAAVDPRRFAFCSRRQAADAKHRTKQPESAKKMIRIHGCK